MEENKIKELLKAMNYVPKNGANNVYIKEYPSHDRIAEILRFVKQMPDFHDVNRLCEFCDESSKIVGLPAEENRLISLICNREKSIKGSHYKIGNTRYKNTDFSGNAGYYTYRWNEIVYSMVNDIRNPQL